MSIPSDLKATDGITKHLLADFIGGWLVGHFRPALIENQDVEVAIKSYQAGDREPRHFHAIATEYTVIASGRVRMNGREYVSGEIVQIAPGHATDFQALEATMTVVIKSPSVANDKYMDEAGSRSSADA